MKKATFKRINRFEIMWLFVFFDLPTHTKKDKKMYQSFRDRLRKSGFEMMQYSVYIRHCGSTQSADAMTKRIEKIVPPKGHVSILRVTDKQFSKIKNFWGKYQEPPKPPPMQLELF